MTTAGFMKNVPEDACKYQMGIWQNFFAIYPSEVLIPEINIKFWKMEKFLRPDK